MTRTRHTQGSTFLWTETYGSPDCPGWRKDRLHDAFFAFTLALLFLSVLGVR